MNYQSTIIQNFIEKKFLRHPEISEIIIQNQKPITSISHNNHYEVLSKENPFDVDHVFDFALSQNQVASKTTPSIGGVINHSIRWHLVVSPITVNLYCLQFRRIEFHEFKLNSLLQKKYQNILDLKLPTKKGCVIFGETFSGKSTLLHSIIHHFHTQQRVVILERFAEISTHNPYWTNLNCYQNPSSQTQNFDYDYLLMQTQRLRPDVLVIGEVTSFNSDFFRQLMHSGFQKIYLTVHGTNLTDITEKLKVSKSQIKESFIVFQTNRNREILCFNEHEQPPTVAH